MPSGFATGSTVPFKGLHGGAGAGTGINDATPGGFRASAFVESERSRELDRRGQYYACTQHDWKSYDWDSRAMQPGRPYSQPLISAEQAPFYVPLRLRRPSSPYRLARVIVNAFTSLLFGEQRWPSIKVAGDADTQDFAEALVKAASLPVRFIQARNVGGAQGTVGLSWCYHEGNPRVDVHEGKNCHVHTWASRDDLIPSHVSEIYRYPKDEWDPIKKRMMRNWYWFRRDFTEDADIYFVDMPMKQVSGQTQEPEWVVDQERSFQHDDGVCHFVWVQNQPSSDVDGQPDYDGLYENLDVIDIIHSVLARAAVLNLDPTLVLKMDLDFVNRMGIKKGSDNALTVGKDGDASYLELGGSSIEVGLKLFDAKRRNALEVAQCIVLDPATLAANGSSSVAIRMLYSSMIQRASGMREQYGAAACRLLEQMVSVAQKRYSESITVVEGEGDEASESPGAFVVNLPPRVVSTPKLDDDEQPTGEEDVKLVERNPGEGTNFELTWGDWFPPTPTDQAAAVTALSTATGAKPVMSQKSAVEQMAKVYNLDPAEENRRLLEEAKGAAAANAAMFGDDAAGGAVGATGELPPGANKLDALQFTASDYAGFVKVNQALELKLGLPELTLDNGKPDPDGNLPIAEYKAKHALALAAAAQADKGVAPGVTHEEPKEGEPLLANKAGPPPLAFPPGGQPPPGKPGAAPAGGKTPAANQSAAAKPGKEE